MIDVDLGLAKIFQIRERFRLRFEASFTNALNRVNYAPPATDVSNPSTFGVLESALPQGAGGIASGKRLCDSTFEPRDPSLMRAVRRRESPGT